MRTYLLNSSSVLVVTVFKTQNNPAHNVTNNDYQNVWSFYVHANVIVYNMYFSNRYPTTMSQSSWPAFQFLDDFFVEFISSRVDKESLVAYQHLKPYFITTSPNKSKKSPIYYQVKENYICNVYIWLLFIGMWSRALYILVNSKLISAMSEKFSSMHI